MGRYLTESTAILTQSKGLVADRVADPFGVFQGPPISEGAPPKGPWQRRHYFTRSSQGRPLRELRPTELAKIDRIPYTWDFGFLLCSSSMWEAAADKEIGYQSRTVKSVWNQFVKRTR